MYRGLIKCYTNMSMDLGKQMYYQYANITDISADIANSSTNINATWYNTGHFMGVGKCFMLGEPIT